MRDLIPIPRNREEAVYFAACCGSILFLFSLLWV